MTDFDSHAFFKYKKSTIFFIVDFLVEENIKFGVT